MISKSIELAGMTILISIFSINFITENIYAQESKVTELRLSGEVDLGMIIAAAALGATLIYNIIQVRNTQTNFFKQLFAQEKQRINEEKALRAEEKLRTEQMRESKKITEGEFWVSLRNFMVRYDDVHFSLRPGGKWSKSNSGPNKPSQWARVESYMGLLEHMNIMLREQILREEVFQKIYGYRINNIFHNDII